MDQKSVGDLGTEDLERGLRPSNARGVAIIAAVAIAMLLVFNSQGLLTWTQALPSSATNIWLAERAADWHERMERAGAAQYMERLRAKLRPYLP